jgi:hypothetical protein
MTTTTTVPASQLVELRTKLTNLVSNVEDRLGTDECADRQYLLEGLLDRLAELATGLLPAPSTHHHDQADALCALCGRFAATARVTAGTPGTNNYRDTPVCTHCTLPAITAAAPAGPVHVTPIPADRLEVTA